MILRWRNPHNGRRYQAVLGLDLFGDSVLWRGWCGADGKRGGEKQDVFTWEGDCLSALHRVSRRRRRRGYVLLDDLLPCSERGRVGGGLGCVQGANPAATQEPRKTVAGIDKASKPLGQVPAGNAVCERT